MSVQHITASWDIQLQPTEKLLLVFLSHHANKADVAWPATRTILKATGLSKATFYRAIAKLKNAGLVVQTYWKGLKAYRVNLTGRQEQSPPDTGESHWDTEASHHETHNCSELYLNCNRTKAEPPASANVISIFKNKDPGMKHEKPKMPVGAPLSQTMKTKLDKPRRKAGGPDTTSMVYRQYRELVRSEFNFKLPEPAAKDLGIMKHLINRWASQTPELLSVIIENYTDFRVYFEEIEGEALKGAYPALPMLLKYHHLGPNFSEWLKTSGDTGQTHQQQGPVKFEVEDPVHQEIKVTVVQ